MTVDIVRAWKDPEYRKTLTSEELASLPPNPAGQPELTEEELATIAGAGATSRFPSLSHCPSCINTEAVSCSASFNCSSPKCELKDL
jgi:mersacidin/lichenicidin family type 2 lantibiotic